jgi:hypothetical protein
MSNTLFSTNRRRNILYQSTWIKISIKLGGTPIAKLKYDPETFPTLVEGYAREGMIEAEIAKKIGVSVKTFEVYKNRYSEFLQALKRGKAPVDVEVEKALLQRALGYSYTETKEIDSEKDGRRTETKIVHVAPDTTAQIFWLKNRKPKEWRDKQEIEHSGEIEQTVIVLPANQRMMKEIPNGEVKPKRLKE